MREADGQLGVNRPQVVSWSRTSFRLKLVYRIKILTSGYLKLQFSFTLPAFPYGMVYCVGLKFNVLPRTLWKD